ncbi:MAG TPA: hypothetical protein VFH71_09070 [Rhodanobacteraceae bacterium]|nr:hypothetical protein [Rhodanobacteraceae bacterium]
MRSTIVSLAATALLAGAGLFATTPARAAHEISCKMTFSLAGWSAFYKTSSGSGSINCSNGQHMRVHLRSKGGGLSFGKSEISGIGKFSGIYDIDEVLGTYGNAEAHAGASSSVRSTVMTKGNVSLALTGHGRGWNLGIDFGKFTISRD